MAQSRTASGRTIRSAGRSDRGRRDNNEDRCHEDADRGIFIVVDGVGGQAAGGEAADIAMKMLRTRLEQKSKAADDRIRQAIVAANNGVEPPPDIATAGETGGMLSYKSRLYLAAVSSRKP